MTKLECAQFENSQGEWHQPHPHTHTKKTLDNISTFTEPGQSRDLPVSQGMLKGYSDLHCLTCLQHDGLVTRVLASM